MLTQRASEDVPAPWGREEALTAGPLATSEPGGLILPTAMSLASKGPLLSVRYASLSHLIISSSRYSSSPSSSQFREMCAWREPERGHGPAVGE
jgi:hypothetical protein